jgi:hypothetical protein
MNASFTNLYDDKVRADAYTGLLLAFVCVMIHALILYLVLGGLRIRKQASHDE